MTITRLQRVHYSRGNSYETGKNISKDLTLRFIKFVLVIGNMLFNLFQNKLKDSHRQYLIPTSSPSTYVVIKLTYVCKQVFLVLWKWKVIEVTIL